MPILGAGSCAEILRQNCSLGIKNESVIATIMRETLLGLQYFHDNG
jgi:serine/threonine protein kinase